MSVPLYEPLNTLKEVGPGIWIVDGGIIKMNMLIFDLPFSTRMTVVKLEDQSLWIHSPITADEGLFEEIDKLGEVKHLVSPNKIHYVYIAEWKERYPEATAWSSPGVEKRAESQSIATAFDRALTDASPSDWSDEIDQLIFKGSRALEEVVFYHKKSRTLILTDLIENFEPKRTSSVFLRTLYKLAGIAYPNGKTPIDLRMTFTGQKEQAREGYRRMLSWHPEKIILAHGRWYDKNGTEELERAFKWLGK